jgi:pimeloyl-ACP methyl ester carboxylesterase
MSEMSDPFTTGSVTSKDGTRIGYRRYGVGPGIVLVQGAMGTVEQFSGLALALSDAFSVYVPERRGRGLSPLPFRPGHTVQRDVEDLAAILAETGAQNVFGLSSGALIALAAARQLPAIQRLAIFEPPLFSRHPFPAADLQRFEEAIARNDPASALTAAGKAVQLVPIVKVLPAWVMTALTNRMIAAEDRRGPGNEPSLREIVLTLQYDFRIVSELHGQENGWKDLRVPVLLLGGGLSPSYMKSDLDTLEAILPHATRFTFPKLDHGSAWDPHPQRNRHGDPPAVAAQLRRFFTSWTT